MILKKTIIVSLIFIFFSKVLISSDWQRTDMGFSETKIYKLSDGYQVIIYNSKSFWNDSLGNYGKNKCDGLVKVESNGSFDGGEVYCESTDQNNNNFIVKLYRDKGDFDGGIGYFIFVKGEGPWKNMVGIKCTYAIKYVDKGFMRLDKC